MAESRIERLRPHWKKVALATALAAIAIVVAKPNYTSLQLASNPEEFAEELDGQPGRAILAGVFDVAFTFAYATLGLIALRAHARDRVLAMWAVLAVLIGAAADQVENLLVITSSAQHDNLHEDMIEWMSRFGMAKWVAEVGLLIALGLMFANWRADRRSTGA